MITIARLVFFYGAMNASKSIQLLTNAHNLEKSGKRILVFTPAIDTRFGEAKVTSRVGISREAIPVHEYTDLYDYISGYSNENISCILIDECQFLKKNHIQQLASIVDDFDIPVVAYGLLKNFKNELFEGSYALLCEADKIEEIKTTCVYCNKKATHILKFKNGQPVYSGESIELGLEDTYKSVCRPHYNNPPLEEDS